VPRTRLSRVTMTMSWLFDSPSRTAGDEAIPSLPGKSEWSHSGGLDSSLPQFARPCFCQLSTCITHTRDEEFEWKFHRKLQEMEMVASTSQ
jgi:hypothetical protein